MIVPPGRTDVETIGQRGGVSGRLQRDVDAILAGQGADGISQRLPQRIDGRDGAKLGSQGAAAFVRIRDEHLGPGQTGQLGGHLAHRIAPVTRARWPGLGAAACTET